MNVSQPHHESRGYSEMIVGLLLHPNLYVGVDSVPVVESTPAESAAHVSSTHRLQECGRVY